MQFKQPILFMTTLLATCTADGALKGDNCSGTYPVIECAVGLTCEKDVCAVKSNKPAETDAPAEETDAPAEETDAPAEETDAPTEETEEPEVAPTTSPEKCEVKAVAPTEEPEKTEAPVDPYSTYRNLRSIN